MKLNFLFLAKIIVENLSTTEINQATSINLKCVVIKTLEMYNLNPELIYSITINNGANILKTTLLIC